MAEKKMEEAVVVSQEEIASGIFSMWIHVPEISALAGPGQFVSLYCRDASRLLPRPISICEIDGEMGNLRLVYRIAGKGTREFSSYGPGTRFQVMGPLGNGFPKERCPEGKTALLIGGGIGIPPLAELAQQIEGESIVVAGYRDETFLTRELSAAGRLYVATEDGSAGTKGTVLDCIRENGLKADVIYSCGPMPMLRGVKEFALSQGIECWISMEERMACGIGACLGCVCKSVETDEHLGVKNKRVCKDGPVFRAEEVEL